MFSQNFGTTMNDNVIRRAVNDPNRTQTFLSMDQQAQIAREIEAKRNARDVHTRFGLQSINQSLTPQPQPTKVKYYDTESKKSKNQDQFLVQSDKLAKKIEENRSKKSEVLSMASTKMSVYNKGATKDQFYKTTNVFVKNSLAKPAKDALTSENLDALDN